MYIEYVDLGDTATFPFGNNDPATGAASDADSTPTYDVRLVGAAASAAPVLSGNCTLVSNAGFPAGCYEVAVAATSGNGFAADSTYFVYVSATTNSVESVAAVGVIKTGGNLLSARDVGMVFKSTVGTVTSQTQLIVDDTISTDDVGIGAPVDITDITNPNSPPSHRYITDVDSATDTITINAAPEFTVGVGDIVRVRAGQHPAYAVANDSNISAIKTKTDSLTFTIAGEVDANMQSVDDITVGESGSGGQGFGST